MCKQETAQAERLIAQCLRIPQGRIAKLLTPLHKFDELPAVEGVGEPEYPDATYLHDSSPRVRAAPFLFSSSDDQRPSGATSPMYLDLAFKFLNASRERAVEIKQ